MITLVVPVVHWPRMGATAKTSRWPCFEDLGGKPRLRWAVDGLRPAAPHRLVLILGCADRAVTPAVRAALALHFPDATVVEDRKSLYDIEAVLRARDHWEGPDPVILGSEDKITTQPIDRWLEPVLIRPSATLARCDTVTLRLWYDPHAKGVFWETEWDPRSRCAEVFAYRRGSLLARRHATARGRGNRNFVSAELFTKGLGHLTNIVGWDHETSFSLWCPDSRSFFTTTDYFARHALDPHQRPSPAVIIRTRARLFQRFVVARTYAGLRAMLHPDVTLAFGNIRRAGREAVLDQLYRDARFCGPYDKAPKVTVRANDAFVAFDLAEGGRRLRGTDYLHFEGGLVREIHQVQTNEGETLWPREKEAARCPSLETLFEGD